MSFATMWRWLVSLFHRASQTPTPMPAVLVPVPPAPVTPLAFADFSNGPGPFTGTADIDYPDNPTGQVGKVARFYYAPTSENRSADRYLSYRTRDVGRLRYGRTLWFKGKFFCPTNPLKDPNWNANDGRKLLDWQGQSDDGWTTGGARFYVGRGPDYDATGSPMALAVEVEELTSPPSQNQYFSFFAHNLVPFDAWHTLKMRLVTNSADRVRDGSLALWVNNSTPTPTFETPHTLYFINEAWAPTNHHQGVPVVGSYFNDFRFGSQLSNVSPEALNTEYRYWKDVGFYSADPD